MRLAPDDYCVGYRDASEAITVSQQALKNRLSAHGLDALVSAVAIALVAAPLLARSRESLDFGNFLWMAWVAGKGTIAAGHPVLFTNTGGDGPFYPLFAFYGGTLFVATGLLGAVFGILTAYIGVWVLAIAAAYLGTLWLSRQLGLRGLIAHAPAICVITSAYYITNIYARGDWPEFVAVSSVPPLAASALHLVRAERWRLLPVLVFAASAVVLTGSHNLTLIWSVTFAAVGLLGVWLAFGRTSKLPYRRLAEVAALGVAALCVNGWFLATDLLHAHDVMLGTYTTTQDGVSAIFDSIGVLLNPFRDAPAALTAYPYPIYLRSFYVNAPMWFLAWGLICGVILLRRGGVSERVRRVWLVALFVVVLFVFVIVNPWWPSVPFPWDETQFPYRVNTYLVFAIAALVFVAGIALQQADTAKLGRRTAAWLKGSLMTAVAVSVGLCVWQQWFSPSTNFWYYVKPGAQLVSVHTLPHSWYAGTDYADASAPIVQVAAGRIMRIPWAKVRGDYFDGAVAAPSGAGPIETNIAGGAYAVTIVGMRYLGRTPAGYEVVERIRRDGSGPVHVAVQTAGTASVVLGRILSFLGLIAIAVVLLSISLLRRFGGPAELLRRARKAAHR